MKPPTLVLDLSVMVDALARPDGWSAQLLRRLVSERDFELALTPAMIDDLEDRLTRPKLLEQLELSARRVRRWVGSLGVLATAPVAAEPAGTEPEPARLERAEGPYVAAARLAGEGAVLVTLESDAGYEERRSGTVVRLEPERVIELLEARRLGAGRSSGAPAAR